ncbi:hypothetical protein SDJN02_10036, partial [Cucurbita argyrosperma subsp. argyrosperma]
MWDLTVHSSSRPSILARTRSPLQLMRDPPPLSKINLLADTQPSVHPFEAQPLCWHIVWYLTLKPAEQTMDDLWEKSTASPSHPVTQMVSKSTAQDNLVPQQCLSTVIAHRKLVWVQNNRNKFNDCNIQVNVAKAEAIQIEDINCNVQEHGYKPMMERVES